MRIRLVKEQTIINYCNQNRGSEKYFNNWLFQMKLANWHSPNDVKKTFNSADLLGNGTNRIIFNIGGNNYRIICSYFVGENNFHLYVNWIGTHVEYDKLCSKNKQYTIDKY